MPIFTVYAKETVFYEIRIDAENEQSARAAIMDYHVSDRDIVDSENFQIESIEQKAEAEL